VSEKKSFVLRLDESTFKVLEVWAADEFRSINGQLEWIIQQQLKASGRLPKDNGSGKHTVVDKSVESEKKADQSEKKAEQ
jgi:hypothetical protein